MTQCEVEEANEEDGVGYMTRLEERSGTAPIHLFFPAIWSFLDLARGFM